MLAEDRAKVMSRLVNNEKVLRLLYEATHSRPFDKQAAPSPPCSPVAALDLADRPERQQPPPLFEATPATPIAPLHNSNTDSDNSRESRDSRESRGSPTGDLDDESLELS